MGNKLGMVSATGRLLYTEKVYASLQTAGANVKLFLIGPFLRHRFFEAILLASGKSTVALAVAGTQTNIALAISITFQTPEQES